MSAWGNSWGSSWGNSWGRLTDQSERASSGASENARLDKVREDEEITLLAKVVIDIINDNLR